MMARAPAVHPCLDAARAYAAMGWLVLPIRPGTKLPSCRRGVHDATTVDDQIPRLWRGGTADVAVAGGGPARLVILDVDGDAGRAALETLSAELGPLPDTRRARTPRGGEHLYFVLPGACDQAAIKNSVKLLGTDLDVRSRGGYVVAPPSPGYVWLDERAPAALPPAWVDRLVALSAPRPPVTRHRGSRTTGYIDAAVQAAVTAVAGAPEGERNNALNREAYSLGGLVATGALDEQLVTDALTDAARAAGLGLAEAERTITSGLRAGRAAPRSVPAPRSATGPVAPVTGSSDGEGGGGGTLDWQRGLRLDDKGRVTKDPGNLTLLLLHDDNWRGCLEYDTFADRITWARTPPTVPGLPSPAAGEELADHHAVLVSQWATKFIGTSFSTPHVWAGLTAAARANERHSLREWLASLTWDGMPRLAQWLHTYLGADDTEYVSEVGRWWAISAVARAYRSGCQADHLLVLEGHQGAGKSTAVRILAGDWFLPGLPDLRGEDAPRSLQGHWIVELGELDAVRGSAASRVKDFLSRTEDVYRVPYARTHQRRRRGCVFIGTTNEHAYLEDPTGARRFWPVAVRVLDRAALMRDREQLWAEAVRCYAAGDAWHPSDELAHEISEAQEARYPEDAWESRIAAWAVSRPMFSAGEVLGECLVIPPERWDRRVTTRVGAILRRLGYSVGRHRATGGGKQRFYTRLTGPPGPP